MGESMAQMTWIEWLQMGGYAIYVWPAYGIALGTLLVAYLRARRVLAQTKQRLLRATHG